MKPATMLPRIACFASALLLAACATPDQPAPKKPAAPTLAQVMSDADAVRARRPVRARHDPASARRQRYPADKAPWLQMAQMKFDRGQYGDAIGHALEALSATRTTRLPTASSPSAACACPARRWPICRGKKQSEGACCARKRRIRAAAARKHRRRCAGAAGQAPWRRPASAQPVPHAGGEGAAAPGQRGRSVQRPEISQHPHHLLAKEATCPSPTACRNACKRYAPRACK